MTVGPIILDCDGLIADSETLSTAVLIDRLAAPGIAITPEDVRRDFLDRGFSHRGRRDPAAVRPPSAAHVQSGLPRPACPSCIAPAGRLCGDRICRMIRARRALTAGTIVRIAWPA